MHANAKAKTHGVRIQRDETLKADACPGRTVKVRKIEALCATMVAIVLQDKDFVAHSDTVYEGRLGNESCRMGAMGHGTEKDKESTPAIIWNDRYDASKTKHIIRKILPLPNPIAAQSRPHASEK